MILHLLRRALPAAALATCALLATAPARGSMIISEYMYQGTGGEFAEFTNIGDVSIDLTGWSYDDDSRTPGVLDLSAFGLVAAGESVLIVEVDADAFRTDWGLSASVKIIGGYTNNLGRNDEINLFDASDSLVDRLTYGDATFPGTIRTQRISGNPGSAAAEGTNMITEWVFSEIGDRQGSYLSIGGDLGNPGTYEAFGDPTVIPEPATLTMLGVAGLFGVAFGILRRRSAR